jgi:hypothetical protein
MTAPTPPLSWNITTSIATTRRQSNKFKIQFPPHLQKFFNVNNTNNISARASFDIARAMFYSSFRDKFPKGQQGDMLCRQFVDSLKLSQSEIRLEVGLNTNNNSFTFGVTPNQANSSNIVYNTENRLNLQDSLCANEYGIFVAQPTSDTDTAYELKSYGNQITFGTAGAAALNSTFFANGNFQVRCNNDVIMPYRGLFNHLYKPQTQQTDALGVGSPADQLRGAEDGFVTMEPNLVLIGSKNYQPQIVLPAALASAAAFLRVVVIFRGVLAQNSTVVN